MSNPGTIDWSKYEDQPQTPPGKVTLDPRTLKPIKQRVTLDPRTLEPIGSTGAEPDWFEQNAPGKIDYDALAKKYGATSSTPPRATATPPLPPGYTLDPPAGGAPPLPPGYTLDSSTPSPGSAIDFDALAKQYGATSSTPPGGDWFDQNAPGNNAYTPKYSNFRTMLDYTGLPGAEQILEGIGEGALQTVGAVGSAMNKIPRVGETLAPSEGLAALRRIATPENALQSLGAGGEQSAELLAAGPERGLGTLVRMGLGAGAGATSVAAHQAGSGTGEVDPTAVMMGGVLGGAPEILPGLVGTKTSRSFINESLGANARDVMYGNPAKAIVNEGITSTFTGDFEKFKDALASGASPADAMKAAGGRMGAIGGKISEIAPQLRRALSNSKMTISVADAIDKPLNDAVQGIIDNRAMTDVEKTRAFDQLTDLQVSLKHGLGGSITPLEANELKQQIGNRINWGGDISVGDEVKPAYRAVYGSLKAAVNKAVPYAANLNDRLTDLLAASEDVQRLSRAEEVGAGRGMTGGGFGRNLVGRAQATAGRFIPGIAANAPQAVRVVGVPAIPDDTARLLAASGLRYNPETHTMERVDQ